MFDPKKIRRDFPILSSRVHGEPLVYLDNAATTQKPRQVIEVLSRYYKLYNSNVHRGSHSLSNQSTALFESARDEVADFIGASSPKEIIWTRGATEAANLIAYSYADAVLCAGDTILVSVLEHHANFVPWQQIALRKSASIVPIPLGADLTIDLEKLQQLLAEHQPKIVAVTHVSNALGVINPIKDITQLAKSFGATVVVDGAQAIAHEPVDVHELGCDFYFFSAHKCYGPTGIGVLWGREALLEKMPPWQFGGEMIESVSFEKTTFNTLPFKLEAGTPPIAEAIGFAQALTYLNSLDRPAASLHEKSLRTLAIKRLSEIEGVRLIGIDADNVGILSFSVDQVHHQDLAMMLDQSGIAVRSGHHCTMPLMTYLGVSGTLRASFALYNTEEEVERFARCLKEAVTALTETTSKHPETRSAAITFLSPDLSELTVTLQSASSWQARLATLQQWAEQLPHLPDTLRQPERLVRGCESQVWLHSEQTDERFWYFAIDSDARIMRGLAYLLLAAFQGKTSKEIHSFDASALLSVCQLNQFLSPSRTNGVYAMVDAIKTITKGTSL